MIVINQVRFHAVRFGNFGLIRWFGTYFFTASTGVSSFQEKNCIFAN